MIDYNPSNQDPNAPAPAPGLWMTEATPDDIAYSQRAWQQMSRDADTLERLMAHNPDRPIVEECNFQLENMGMDTRLVDIEPMPVTYETPCTVCEEDIPAWTDGYYVTKNDGQNAYLCGDRSACSNRVLAKVFQQAVHTEEGKDLFGDDDD